MSLEYLLRKVQTDKEQASATERTEKTRKKQERIEEMKKALSDYIRVGTAYFKKMMRTDRHGTRYEVLERWKLETLQEDFKQALHELNVYRPKKEAKWSVSDFIDKYDAFCNEPDNVNYKRVVDGCYNLYSPLTHKSCEWKSPAQTQNIEQFLVHIFGEQIEVALDYLTILLLYPKQILPILCLVSKENNTGKTTFLNFLRAIFQSNAVILTSDDFQDTFNSHYAHKLLVMIDENFVDVEKKREKERIKQLGTATKIMMHMKGVDKKEIDYYGKLIMTSNYEENFININEDDIRFWVVKVNPMEKRDPDLLDKLVSEIPAFINFLTTKRAIKYPKTERHWFANELLATEARQKVIDSTKPLYEDILDTYFQWYFDESGASEVTVSVTDVLDELQKYSKYLHHKNIKEYLKKKGTYLGKDRVQRYNYYSYLSGTCTDVQRVGRPYLIRKKDGYSNEDTSEFVPF